jgi:chromate transporter
MKVPPTFAEALRVWARIGLLSFGGPAGQIALLHREVVELRGWLMEKEFLSALNFCMLLPGPEAMQLATYAGWKLHGVRGGLAAGILFVLPGASVILALSVVYALFGQLPLIEALFWGVKAAVVAVVLEALAKVAGRALKARMDWIVAGLSFLALFVFALPFPLVILAAALLGYFRGSGETQVVAVPDWKQSVRTTGIWLVLWLAPLAALYAVLGSGNIFTELARIFSTLAVVTFGGAYSVLTSLGQDVVERAGWLSTQEIMDGLALAETTPGPLILVGQFVGFTAAAKLMGSLWAGIAASAVFLWMTFVPCFLWIFAGAPWIEYIQARPRFASALANITAAVVGVILNLSLWFALHVVFGRVERLSGPLPLWWPDLASFDPAALLLSLAMGFALLKAKIGIPKTLALAALAGLIWKLIAT